MIEKPPAGQILLNDVQELLWKLSFISAVSVGWFVSYYFVAACSGRKGEVEVGEQDFDNLPDGRDEARGSSLRRKP